MEREPVSTGFPSPVREAYGSWAHADGEIAMALYVGTEFVIASELQLQLEVVSPVFTEG